MTEPVRLTPSERKRLNQKAFKGLLNAVIAQSCALVVVVLIAAIWGLWAAVSALAGGLAYLLPSAFFVLHMLIKLFAQQNASAMTFFYGEGFKLFAAVALLFISYRLLGSHIVWPALLFGLLAVLKAYVLLLATKKL
ncbi:ATP synthase subunit I [Brackiella oedipodis]|uniref:ATP synthase subunit I n=1 Tax=Brackiella oedipodis TaxID=124225 RepID=UPI0004909BA0|nr:ATP synthase subunit I [Brackiella oedipodis]